MAINFPANPVKGQIHNVSPGVSYIYSNPTSVEYADDEIGWERVNIKTALPKNYIVNPSMQISQQNDVVSSTVSGFYPADQWMMSRSMATGLSTIWRLTGATPEGSGWQIHMNVGTAQTVLASGEWLAFLTYIEGQRMADFRWGTASAKAAVLKFWFVGKAGTYTALLREPANTLHYACTFTIPANKADTFMEWVFAIPGPTTGTWPITNAIGLQLWFTLAAGSGYISSTAFAWTAGGAIAGPGQTNGAAVVNNAFRVLDVGLYLDPYKTGVAPPFEIPDYGAELRRCQRYWYKGMGMRGFAASATSVSRLGSTHPVAMRIAPTLTVVGAPKVFDGTATPTLAGTITSYSTVNNLEFTQPNAGLIAGRPCNHYFTAIGDYIAVSARM